MDEKTLVELYLIWFHTGALDMIKQVDEGLYMILSDVMEERLEEPESNCKPRPSPPTGPLASASKLRDGRR